MSLRLTAGDMAVRQRKTPGHTRSRCSEPREPTASGSRGGIHELIDIETVRAHADTHDRTRITLHQDTE